MLKSITTKQRRQLLYPISKIKTPFGEKSVLYADFIASGRPSPEIEKYITTNVYTKYSNTHSNSTNGICMKNEIDIVRKVIKKEFKLDDSYEVLFKGAGSTDCINFLLNCLDYKTYNKVHIFITTYEHYSNHLPFVELSKLHKHISLNIIPLTSKHEVDIDWFEEKLSKIYNENSKKSTLIITSIIHCSNLTGYFTPIQEIKTILNKNKHPNVCQYFFVDAACSAPYRKIDGSQFDAIFISPHKYIGGVGTPGLLIAKTCLFQKSRPVAPGGSCIKTTNGNEIVYADNIEIRESAGTPAIIGILRIGQSLKLKQTYQKMISHNESVLVKIMNKYIDIFSQKYPNIFFCVPYRKDVDRLPIFSFHHKHLHYNFLVVLLNDLFGIQTRGGKSCDGLFMDYIKSVYDIDGFCRISLHWTMRQSEVDYIFKSVDYVFQHGEKYVSKYKYNKETNLWKTNKTCKRINIKQKTRRRNYKF